MIHGWLCAIYKNLKNHRARNSVDDSNMCNMRFLRYEIITMRHRMFHPGVGLILDNRIRNWPNIKRTLGQVYYNRNSAQIKLLLNLEQFQRGRYCPVQETVGHYLIAYYIG